MCRRASGGGGGGGGVDSISFDSVFLSAENNETEATQLHFILSFNRNSIIRLSITL